MAAPRLNIRLLGTPEVQSGETPLVLNHQKALALLFYLAATGQAQTRDHLTALLWSEAAARAARHSLRSALYRLRQALRHIGADHALVENGTLLSLHDEVESDLRRFQHLLSDSSQAALIEAAALYRGPFLHGFVLAGAPSFDEWARTEEARLTRAYHNTLERLASYAEQREAWSEAIDHLQQIVQHDPLAEEAQRRLMSLYLRSGQPTQAVRQYHAFQTRLRDELGVEPSPETQALLEAALRRRPRAPAVETPRPARPPQTLPFVGREQLLTRLLALSQEALTGRGVTVLLQGEGGIGKSRLLDELATALVTWGLSSATYGLPDSATCATVSHRPDQDRRRDEPWAVAIRTNSC